MGILESPDVERSREIKFNWNLKSIHAIHLRVRRPLAQVALQGIERSVRTLRNDFNRSIR